MPLLRFLSGALAKGVAGYQSGKLEKQRLETTAANTAADRATKRRHEAALEAFQQQEIALKKAEELNKRDAYSRAAAKDERDAEKQRLEVDKLRHPGKYREPTYNDSMKVQAMAYRDSLVAKGMPLLKANQEMKLKYPLVDTAFDAMKAYVGGQIADQQP